MQRLVYWLTYPILWFISILPFPVFYFVSDLIFLLVFYVIRYRKKTVLENIRLVFPDKTDAECKRIRKAFYRHMVDMFLEMIKTISISSEELHKRFRFKNVEYLRKLEEQDKSLILMLGHYASYEWILALMLYGLKFQAFAIYKKIKNPHFDDLVKRIRQRFDAVLVPTVLATKVVRDNEQKNKKAIYAMIADQSPKKSKIKEYIDFMGIEVPVFTGSENWAKQFNLNVIYLNIEKKRRGFYEATILPITEDAATEPPNAITEKFVRYLENQIREKPELYLWTHKRWKYRKK